VRITDHVTPISTAHGDDRELGKDDSSTNGSGNFLGALNTQTNVSIRVTNDYKGLEAGSLTSTGLLLYWHNLHDLILQFSFSRGVEEVNYLKLLDGEREEVDLF